MALRPKGDRAYLFGLHQCSSARTWSTEEQRLFEEMAHRLAATLSNLIAFRTLRDSESRLEAAQRVAHIGWWERDFETRRVSLSDEACRIFGVQPVGLPQWEGRWLSLIHPEDRARAAAASEAALAGGPRYDIEYRVVRPDGDVRVVHSQGDVTRDEAGRPVRQFGVMQDITALRQAEMELRASETRFRALVDHATDAFLLHADDSIVIDVNQQACASLGYSREELIGMHPRQFDADPDPAALAQMSQRIGQGELVTFETLHRRKDGSVFPVEVRARRFQYGEHHLRASLVRDITERKRAEAELRARQEMLDLAQTAARALAFDWYIARDSKHHMSPELERMYGLEPGTFAGTYESWKKLLYAEDRSAVMDAIKRAHQTGDIATEFRVVHKDGSFHWLRAKGRMFFDAEGRPERMVGFMFDITDLRHAGEALRSSEQRFRTFVDHARDAFFLMNSHLLIVDVNRQACDSLGLSRDELIGMHPREFDVGLDEASIRRLMQRALAGEIITFETTHRRKDGGAFPVEIRTGVFSQGGEPFYLALARDISERRSTEEKLREKDDALQAARTELARVSRLTTLGELTTSIAHEVSQPLGGMVASAGACVRWLAADPPAVAEAHAALANIVADGKRAREVIARIRALTKRQAPRKDWLDINQEIMGVLTLAERELRSQGIVLRTELRSPLPRLVGDRVQLQQVLLNLIVNAIEAMGPVNDRARELTVVSRQDDAEAVVVEVRDCGPGLDSQNAEQVFEAFYTTKTEGIGIGLSISRSIIEAHGGRLWAAPNEPHGAVFRLSLPVTHEAVA